MTAVAAEEPDDGSAALSKRRRIAIWALIVLASLIALISVLAVWTDRQMLDNGAWNDATKEAIADPAVQDALSVYLVNQLYDNVDVSGQLEQKLPPNVKPLAGPISAALRQPTANGIEFLLGRPRVQQLFVNASAVAHQKLVNVLENKTGFGISTGSGAVTLDLHELIVELGQELGISSAALDKVPADAGVITLLDSDQLSTAQTAVHAVQLASAWLAVLVFVLFGLAIYLARGSRRARLRDVGWAFVLVGLLVLIIRRLGGNWIIGSLVDPEFERSGHRLWLIWTEILGHTGRALVFYGLVVVIGAVLAGPTRPAVATRRSLAPAFRERPAIVWGAVAGAYLLLVLWAPTYALTRPLWILIFGILIAVGVELLSRQSQREFPDQPAGEGVAAAGLQKMKTRVGGRGGSQPSAADEIAKLRELQQSGAIDDAEFERAKQLALS
jgi:putative oligomerization/nucleic acid binding protein